jgi:membrane-bound metal-dependent hydrolase YbcI (DUF457 family)
MFIGHFGLGFATKKITRKPSLGTTFLAAQFIDLLWPFFLLLGMEKVAIDPGNTVFTPLDFVSYPYSHSLVAVAIWALLFGVIYYLVRKDTRSAVLLASLVISHWLLDLITHRPDLPLSFSEETKVGLGLWNNKAATITIEVLLFSVGVWLYSTATEAKNRKGTYALWGLVLFFVAIYFMNAFGDPPPDATAIGYVGLAQWLFILWGYWVDRNRIVRSSV